MTTYSDAKEMERHIANDVTPSRSTTDILAHLKLLNDTAKLADPKTALGSIAAEETKYLVAAMEAIRTNRVLRDRFGTGLQAAMDVSTLLKDRFNTKVFEAVIDSSLTTEADLDPAPYAVKAMAMSYFLSITYSNK
jgi:hypothetical protein